MLNQPSNHEYPSMVIDLNGGSGADPEGGRRGGGGGGRGVTGARPPFFVPISLKNPLNWPKKTCWRAPEPPAPPSFSNPGSAPEGFQYVCKYDC